MIDLHTHSLFSDGVLLPSELVYRAKFKGYDTIGLTDHGDHSTVDYVIPRLIRVAAVLSAHYDIRVIPGIELTYVPPALIASMVTECRKLGARLIIVHGETPAETVPPGTNHAAIFAGADILAHPGPIAEEDVIAAREHGVCLEITTRGGHNRTNPHVAELAKKHAARMVLDSDSHGPEDFLNPDRIAETLRVAGLGAEDFARMQDNSRALAAAAFKPE